MSKAKILAMLVLVAWIASIPFGVYMWWQIEQDVGANLDRAIQSSNAEDMKGYLIDARDGMEKWGYTVGHYALIFKTPQNDAALDYRAVNRMIERLDLIEQKPQDSTEYQVAIDDIRGTIRDAEWEPYHHWAIHTPLAVMYWFPWLGWAVAALVGGIAKMVETIVMVGKALSDDIEEGVHGRNE